MFQQLAWDESKNQPLCLALTSISGIDLLVSSSEAETTDHPTFESLGLNRSSLQAIESAGFETPSPIQAAFIPVAIKNQDVIGLARTGTGKTTAFVMPILEQIDLSKNIPQALILAPTRELSEQVAKEAEKLSSHSPCHTVCLVGGRPIRSQINEIKKGPHLIVGTPGRLIDLIRRRELNLKTIKFVVLDEADRMLDIGFRPDIEKILRRCPKKRQTLLLSATMAPEIEQISQKYMQSPEKIDVTQGDAPAQQIEQFYLTADPDRKFGALVHLLKQERPQQVIVFSRTKIGADKLFKKFSQKLGKQVASMHGDLPQGKRDQVMKKFRQGNVRMLIATDVVGRGIDISGISHIINYDIPEFCDDYLHRVGRTGRLSSDAQGRAITFVTREQGDQLTNIEMRINQLLPEYFLEEYEAARPIKSASNVEEPTENYEAPEFVIP
ncbi:MAG: DEAD/DEAH box helicase [Planctomycetaceae bacterium]|nr:DEAD/DEAH box helicase [Planctomycetaceae bacterium]